jgi:SAM-dependent methyltransferase
MIEIGRHDSARPCQLDEQSLNFLRKIRIAARRAATETSGVNDSERDYVLGTHDAEIQRLELQHRLWRHRVLDCWRRARIAAGARVLDVGAGPGFATLDLAEIVGPAGTVTAIDLSNRFLQHLRAAAAQRGFTNIRTILSDLDRDELPDEKFDVIWARWTHIFLRDPRALIGRISRALKPGGRVVLHEYSDYGAWKLVPDVPSFNRFVAAVMASWRATGGEPNIGAALPAWLEAAGVQVQSAELVGYFLAPSDPMWQWPVSYVDTNTVRLADLKFISDAEGREIRVDVAAATASPASRMITPTVLEIIATRS